MPLEKVVGLHIVAELYGCKPELISRLENVRKILDEIVKKSDLTVIDSKHHQFKPHGVTCLYLLAESHLFVHTWPEYGYIAVDIFTCGDEKKAKIAYELIVKEFKPKKVKRIEIKRGIGEIINKKEIRILV